MENNSNLLNSIIDIQKILKIYYEDTKKIFILCEKFADVPNHHYFYDLLGILDEFNQIIINPSKENRIKRKKVIKSHFLNAQNYSLMIGIKGIIKDLKEKENKTLRIKAITLEKELIRILKIYVKKNDDRDFRKISRTNIEVKNCLVINLQLKYLFKKILQLSSTNLYIKSNWGLRRTNRSIGKFDLIQMTQIKELMNKYALVRLVIFDIFRRRDSHYYYAVTELRDALDHLGRLLLYDNTSFDSEISNAFEHMRRAAVETVQFYCEEEINNIKMYLFNKKIKKYTLQEKMEIYNKIKKHVCIARYLKSEITWCQAISNFYDAIKIIENVKK